MGAQVLWRVGNPQPIDFPRSGILFAGTDRRGLQAKMLRKRYYILFVARDEDGGLRKIPLPLKYVYGFVAAAIVGAFTIVGLAGSYTRMVLKTESYNQVRADRETLRQNYQRMAAIAHNRSVQVASLGALANEVSALYGLRQNRLQAAAQSKAGCGKQSGVGCGSGDAGSDR